MMQIISIHRTRQSCAVVAGQCDMVARALALVARGRCVRAKVHLTKYSIKELPTTANF